MRKKKYISFIIAILVLITTIPAVVVQAEDLEKQYFIRAIGAYARADMYEKEILASLTIGQAILESDWGRSTLSLKANNLFGIKTFGGFEGLIYDRYNGVVCANYDDYRLLSGDKYDGWGWRAYRNWQESVSDHSDLFVNDSLYAAVVGETDYNKALDAILPRYTSDAGYKERVVDFIEDYGLTKYDDTSPNKYGVIAIKINEISKEISLDSTYSLSAAIIGDTTQELVWESTDRSVATVNSDGIVTAKGKGVALITATIGDREGCCIVKVPDGNAYVIDNLYVRSEGRGDAETLGKFTKGQDITVTGEAVAGWYPVTGKITTGKIVSGWSSADYITLNASTETVKKVAFSRYELCRDIDLTFRLKYAVGSIYAVDKTLEWTSSNPDVATVKDGKITTHKHGNAVIKATAVGGASAECMVYVTDTQVFYTARTTADLRLRAEGNEDSKTLHIFKRGENVTVIENYDNPPVDEEWYCVEYINEAGDIVIGYSKADYIVLESKSGDFSDDFDIVNDRLEIRDGYLYGALPDIPAMEFISSFSNINSFVYNSDGKLLTSSDLVTTGSTLRLIESGYVVNQVGIVIKGDISGNGKIDPVDCVMLKRHILGTIGLEDEYLRAAYITEEGVVSPMDYLKLKRHIMGTYDIMN